ncbi:CPBP family intramembrane glutamic endopeptidase [Planosporangium sp. 12N6]|uniref:CPBP family intramembrane glutamic endopeptidase n=1 Tax=Planosporangium spinosum TaxID=3402278 RepID=UPI003CEA3F67
MSTRPNAVPGGVRGLVHHFPLVAFFSLAFGLTWAAWTPYVLSTSGLGWIPLRIPPVSGNTQIIGMLPGVCLGPVTAALLVTAAAEGRPGLRRWSRRLVRWRVGWRWYLVVLAGVPATILLATFALPASWGHARMVGVLALAAYLPVLVVQIVTTALLEEPGWRDFALPRLQRRFGAVPGTAVLGTLWGCWHLPLFLTEWGGWPHVSWVQPAEFVAGCVSLSLVMTWVFNRTGESLPIIMVLHAGINTTYSLVWPHVFPTLDRTRDPLLAQLIGSTVVALMLIVATRGRLGLRGEASPVDAKRITAASAPAPARPASP